MNTRTNQTNVLISWGKYLILHLTNDIYYTFNQQNGSLREKTLAPNIMTFLDQKITI